MYFRLLGQERLITIGDQIIIFPEYGDSLKIIKLSFSRIREIYFGKDRHGRPDNLIIKYDLDGHAYIQRTALSKEDFNAICEIFKHELGIAEIEVR